MNVFFLGKASRFCDKDDGWQKPSLVECVSNSFLELQKQVNEMNYSALIFSIFLSHSCLDNFSSSKSCKSSLESNL